MKFFASVLCIFALFAISMTSAAIVCPRDQDTNSYVVQFPSPLSCSEFYKCDNGIPILQTCPVGLHYNAKKRVCDYISAARCNLANYQ